MLAAAAALAGCSTINDMLASDKIDYRSKATKTKTLEVPPDLTQLARDSRYAPQGGVISAAAAAAQGSTVQPAAVGVAPAQIGKVRIERQGNQRWLVIEGTPPEALWPEVRAFWLERGFTLSEDNPQTGVMETDWAENRAKIPQDFLRRTLGRVIDGMYDTGERDRFRTRLERSPAGTEIYVSHRGMEEVFTTKDQDRTRWVPRDPDPGLEAEILSRLMAKLGVKEEVARTQVAATPAPESPPRARNIGDGVRAALEVDEPFDRAWRRVGLALDRGGFTIEDRDRSAGLYFVRYIDPKVAQKEEPGWLARLFGASRPDTTPARYRVQVKANGEKTLVSIFNASGAPETGDPGKSIVASLVRELR